jgi:hypothetical protein
MQKIAGDNHFFAGLCCERPLRIASTWATPLHIFKNIFSIGHLYRLDVQ